MPMEKGRKSTCAQGALGMLTHKARLGVWPDKFPNSKRCKPAKAPRSENKPKFQPQNSHWPERVKHKGKKAEPQIVQGEMEEKEVYTRSCSI